MSNRRGTLYVVATPIGNLEDLSPRAVRILGEVKLIAAEDTRHSRQLLERHGLRVPLISCHEHNERTVEQRIIGLLEDGQDVALVSDAGTPLISDPGYRLVRAAHRQGLRVVPVPGPSAVICALSAAGLPTDRFAFEGYPPDRPTARRRRLEGLADEPRTLVFYEAPHRILDFLTDAAAAFGPEREGAVARELTKKFETLRTGRLGELRDWLAADPDQRKGEFVVLVHGGPERERGAPDPERVLDALAELPLKQAAAIAARITGLGKNELYQRGLERRNTGSTKA